MQQPEGSGSRRIFVALIAAAALFVIAAAISAFALGGEAPTQVGVLVPAVLALAALAPLLLLFVKLRELRADADQQKAMAEQQKRENDRNQEAILRLLDELSSLAQGDLTAQATVTEDITGAIADSVNYA